MGKVKRARTWDSETEERDFPFKNGGLIEPLVMSAFSVVALVRLSCAQFGSRRANRISVLHRLDAGSCHCTRCCNRNAPDDTSALQIARSMEVHQQIPGGAPSV
jgi:hypothetical protein